MKKKLLLISNSTNSGDSYLEWTKPHIKDFLNTTSVKRILFFPFAGISLSEKGIQESYDIYEEKVNSVFNTMGYEVYSIHHAKDPVQAIRDAIAIAVGGGNTFHLVYMLHKLKLMKHIRLAVENGIPYLGWSAGANIACPALKTTNDMPIIEPESFECLNLVPFQINPHYLDAHPEGFGGETREQRIEEFLIVNDNLNVVGLREGTLLRVENGNISLVGHKPFRLFRHGNLPKEYQPGSDIKFLLK